MTLRVAIEGVAFWASRLPGWDIAQVVIRGEQPAPEAPTKVTPAGKLSVTVMAVAVSGPRLLTVSV